MIRRLVFRNKRHAVWTVGTVFGALLLYSIFFAPPRLFPEESYVRVGQGETVASLAKDLKEAKVIRSSAMFTVISKLYGEGGLIAGEYYFLRPQSALTVVHRIMRGDFNIEPVRITVPEGTSAYGITELLRSNVPEFDVEEFYALAVAKEGRLFPDTYYVLPGEDPRVVLKKMEDNFVAQVSHTSVALPVAQFGRPLNEVLVMASLLEKEANNERDRRLIAGILWKRIELGIPLQVDAVFPYIIGKNTYNITREELQTDSPYNTYTNLGLPPGPITNPGLGAIVDAVSPVETDYLFYLSDRSGTMYYSVTYEQHLVNKRKYIGS